MKNHPFAVAALAAAALFALLSAGCSGKEERPVVEAVKSKIPLNTVEFLDEDLQPQGVFFKDDVISIQAANSQRTDSGTMLASVILRNHTDRPKALMGRTTFFDEREIPIEGPTAWQRIFLPAGSLGRYEERSARKDAAYFYVEIKEGN